VKDRAGTAEPQSDAQLEIGHVLFMDIVGFSKLLVDEQRDVSNRLNRMVRDTEQFRAAEMANKLIRLPTGDGMVLVFYSGPEAPARCAIEISRGLKDSSFGLRMGIHSGPVNKVSDVNDRSNLTGTGINVAQRVMDCGDAGHILLSKRVSEDLEQHSKWRPRLHRLGEFEVKHGVKIEIVNLYTEEAGNPALPEKLKTGERSASAQIPVVPDHEVLRVVGRGAYGEIWLARSLTGALRAVKVVYRSTFESERAFQREFQGMSSFEPISRAHDGFVDILHVGRTGDYLYYIMELADDHLTGREIDVVNYAPRTLRSELDRQTRLSASESIQLGLSLTEALAALHGHGLAHRDIKPSNIIFIDGVPKLADIGLVAASGQRSFVGTEGYVPPEGPGTPQADIFSLGKVLYEISTGKDRLDFPELDSTLTSRPDKDRLLLLNDVLVKACAGDPHRRYDSALAMHDDLAAVDRGESPARRRPRAKFVIAAVLGLVAAIGGFFLWSNQSTSPPGGLHLQATVRTDPPGALVVLGDHTQRSPATFADLEPRKYSLRIMNPGYDPVETIVDLGGKKSAELPLFRLNRSKGALEVQSDQAGTQFTLRGEDGQIVRDGTMPAKIVDLPTGKYSLVAKRGDWEVSDTVEIQRGETARKSLPFLSATLSVTSEPAGADVLVDGSERGRTPLRVEVPARAHELVARLAGWPEEHRSVLAKAQSENTAHFVFANGSVKITTAPGGATVIANGRELGQTPLVIEEVTPGAVSYELRLAGYQTTAVGGQVEPQQQAFLAARLEKSVGPEEGQPWTNSLGMKFVPLGKVRISVWETRVQDYDAFCAATGRRRDPPDFVQGPTHPIVKVNWFDANAFCKWLTDKEHDENALEERQFYRLPTDLEWSAAIGLPNEGGSTPESRDGKIRNEFPWGKQWPPPTGIGNYADKSARHARSAVLENYNDGFAQTAPAGSFKANGLGLYDLGGNVWEWCAEGYKGDVTGGRRDWGVLRGGSWATSNRTEMQSSYRNVVDRNERDVIYGFRCVLIMQPKEEAHQP
jgi:formylglycine-generating enzyme required for sulfatase activity